MSSDNLGGVTQTLAKLISNGIKGDEELQKFLHSEELISLQAPSEQEKPALISIYLYSVTENTSMRNQPQSQQEPRTLLYLNLHYLITPLTGHPQIDQLLLGKVMQILAEKPVLRGSDLLGSLSGGSEELRVVFDSLSVDDLTKVWTTLAVPYKLAVSYSVYPVPIKSEVKTDAAIIRKPALIREK